MMANKISDCPCGSQIEYKACCGVYHHGEQLAPTPEALMRSRYAAYSLGNVDYIKRTMQGKPLVGFKAQEAEVWAKSIEWIGLEIVDVKNTSSQLGYVEFIARFIENGKTQSIHERSEFRYTDGQWFYVDGVHPVNDAALNAKKVGRNIPCPCGSQKKFKHCHGNGR